MRIILITPAPPRSRAGNRATATRWSNLLKAQGHQVDIATEYQGKAYDLMIALHAWRSAEAIKLFADRYQARPLIVAITGTDAYRFIHSHAETTLQSIALADHLVGLHDCIADTLPDQYRHKMHVILQSAQTAWERKPYKNSFRICIVGHLRDEKDPLRPALAVRNIPGDSKIKIDHYGTASPDWTAAARAEMAMNPRYTWHGEVPHHKVRRAYQKCQLLVLPSRMEGGANVISEAVVAGLPVVASDIPGSTGLLGEDYPGYYPVEDEQALQQVLLRAETESDFYQSLVDGCRQIRNRFSIESESNGWRELIHKL